MGPGITSFAYPYAKIATDFPAPPVDINYTVTQSSSQGVSVSPTSAPIKYNYAGPRTPTNQTAVIQPNGDVVFSWQTGDTVTPLAQQNFKITPNGGSGATSTPVTVTGATTYTYPYANIKSDNRANNSWDPGFSVVQVDGSGNPIGTTAVMTGTTRNYVRNTPTVTVAQDDTNQQLVFTITPATAPAVAQPQYSVSLYTANNMRIRTLNSAPGVNTIDYPYAQLTSDYGGTPTNVHYSVFESTDTTSFEVSSESAIAAYNYTGQSGAIVS